MPQSETVAPKIEGGAVMKSTLQRALGAGLILAVLPVLTCSLESFAWESPFNFRKGGDHYTSDLIEAHIAIGPVAEARVEDRNELDNRQIALSTEEIQREFAEGITEIHRAATITRIGNRGGSSKALEAAREQGADILMMPRIEQLTIDRMGRNGLEPLAMATDVVLFPVTLGVALFSQGERAGLGYQYIPINNIMVSLRMNLDFYRVSDGKRLARRTYPTYVDVKVNKDNADGARLDSTDDLRNVGRDQGRYAIRQLGRRIAKEEIPALQEVSGKPTSNTF
jgi:hypothetical protein